MRRILIDWRKLHFVATAIAAALLIPAGLYTHLLIIPPSTDLNLVGGLALQSIVWAGLLYLLITPGAWSPFSKNPWRILMILPAGVGFSLLYGLSGGLLLALAVFAIGEFHYRQGDWKRAGSAVLPWLYLVAGIKIASYYSSVIVSLRPCTEYDEAFRHIDSLLLMGGSINGFSNAASALYRPAEAIYYCMFGAMGAGILFLSLSGDRRTAFQLSGAILTAYYLSLVLFYIFPAQGPFVAGELPAWLFTATMQSNSLSNATALYHHLLWITAPDAYYVAFPSLHVAQPLIAVWYLRRWRVAALIVLGYCALLVPAILILRWHYLFDILGGLAVAALAVALVGGTSQSSASEALPTPEAAIPR